MLSNESLQSPAFSRSNSQASIDSASMEDFWREIESIKENSLGVQEEQTPAEAKPLDGEVLDWSSPVLSFFVCSLVLLAGRNHSTSSLTSESVEFGKSAACSHWFISAGLAQGGFCVRWHDLKEGCQHNPNWSLMYHHLGMLYPSVDLIHNHLADWVFSFWWLLYLYTWPLITKRERQKKNLPT